MKKLLLKVIVLIAAIAASNLFSINPANAQGPMIYIPDFNFKNYLLTNFDANIDGNIDSMEAANVTGMIWVNNLTIADLTGIEAFTALTSLGCEGNQLSSLDVSANTALTGLSCGSNQLTSLDVSSNTALAFLNCGDNYFTNLDVSANTALIGLECTYNQLTSLNVSANTTLEYLFCYYNQLTSLNVSANTSLTELNCDQNLLSILDVSANTALTELSCWSNQLTSLTVSGATALTELYCMANQLTSLDVSTNTALTNLHCSINQLTSLDVSNDTALIFLECFNNHLTSLNVKNGNNTNLSGFDATSNPNLACIQVDNPAYSNGNSNWNKDATAIYSTNCVSGIQSISEINSSLSIYPNPFSNSFTFELKEVVKGTATISLLNMLGQTVFENESEVENGQPIENIFINDKLKAGLYILRIEVSDKMFASKVIIN